MNQFGMLNTDKIGQALETQVKEKMLQRRRHERKWYENNFFDDGYHFRTISKKTGRVIDRATVAGGNTERAIPRASRQIRGVSNLMFAAEPFPVVYPARITKENYRDATGMVDEAAFMKAKEQSKQQARKQGTWLTTEWEDEQELNIKLINMMLKASKNSIAYLGVTSDTDKQIIHTDVYDAFDLVLDGDKEDLEDCPLIDKSRARLIEEILADPMYQKARLNKLTPDNRYASSDLKEAYMTSRYGSKTDDTKRGTLLEHETFLKEVLSEKNWEQAIKMGSDTGAMEGKSRGDIIMRHTFWAAGVTLHDEYINYDCYPFAEFRFEPGPLYQKPFIENFIPQNKSLDIVMTRLEQWINSMIVGVYQKRKGENFQISNFAGGQVMEYETTPLSQMQNATVGSTPFNVINLLDKYIEEQGASTSALSQIPSGVKANVAIENLKATEYGNLKISTLMLKRTIKKTAELMLERADKDYLEPKEVEYMEDGDPDYFDVIGKRGYDLSQKVGKELPPDITVLSKDTKVRIEIEPGMGLTTQGQRESMQQIITFIAQFSEAGKIPPEALNMAIKKFLETFGYGNTQEFMEALEDGLTEADMTEQTIEKVKLAVAETMKDLDMVGPKADQKLVDSTKLGTVEAMKDLGMTDGMGKEPEKNKVSISYKDLPVDGKVQAAAQAGIAIDPQAAVQKEAMAMKPIAKAPQK